MAKRVEIVKITVDNVEVDAKECSKCGEVKALLEYYSQKTGIGGRRANCKQCSGDYRKQWYEDNHEEQVARMSKWYKKNRGYSKMYYAENKDKYRRWHVNNKDKKRLQALRRRARIKFVPWNWTEDTKELVLQEFGGGCALTQCSEYQMDHVIPIATGRGGTVFGNMMPLRPDLNLSKGDTNLFEWFEGNCDHLNLSKGTFNNVIEILARQNNMSSDEYREYVAFCHENPISIDEICTA